MHNEYHLKRENWERIVDSLYEVLKNYLYSFSQSSEVNPFVFGFITVILDNISNTGFNMKSEIEKIPLNQDYFKKLFALYTGKTPLNYLLRKRMYYARQLLSSQSVSHLSIKEISWMCGYGNYYYFSRQFRKCFGLSPRGWIKNFTEDMSNEYDDIFLSADSDIDNDDEDDI